MSSLALTLSRPITGFGQRPAAQHANQVAAVIGRSVDVGGGVHVVPGGNLGCFADRRGCGRLALQHLGGMVGLHRTFADAEKDKPRLLAQILRFAQDDDGRDAY